MNTWSSASRCISTILHHHQNQLSDLWVSLLFFNKNCCTFRAVRGQAAWPQTAPPWGVFPVDVEYVQLFLTFCTFLSWCLAGWYGFLLLAHSWFLPTRRAGSCLCPFSALSLPSSGWWCSPAEGTITRAAGPQPTFCTMELLPSSTSAHLFHWLE